MGQDEWDFDVKKSRVRMQPDGPLMLEPENSRESYAVPGFCTWFANLRNAMPFFIFLCVCTSMLYHTVAALHEHLHEQPTER